MILRCEHDNGVVTYESELLSAAGVRHAFSTRVGGVSRPPYDSLNLGYLTKDTCPDGNTAMAENFRRLRAAIGLERRFRVQVGQVHGAGVYVPPHRPQRMRDIPPADAIVSDVAGSMPTIRTADCVPILVSRRDGRVVAAIHAGWRGIIAGVIPATIGTMLARFGIPAEQAIAAIGPCIGVHCFEVGPEVSGAFEQAGLSVAVARRLGPKPHIDLAAAAALQLRRSGVRADSIDRSDRCTHRDAAEFFSHRRDHGRTGRMAAVIAVKEA